MVLRMLTICSLSLVLFSCGSGQQDVKEREQQEEKREPMTIGEARDVFIRHCESCHGIDGRKQASGAADLSVTKKTDAEMLQTIKNGNDKGMMPYAEILTEREQQGLVDFVKSLQQKN